MSVSAHPPTQNESATATPSRMKKSQPPCLEAGSGSLDHRNPQVALPRRVDWLLSASLQADYRLSHTNVHENRNWPPRLAISYHMPGNLSNRLAGCVSVWARSSAAPSLADSVSHPQRENVVTSPREEPSQSFLCAFASFARGVQEDTTHSRIHITQPIRQSNDLTKYFYHMAFVPPSIQ